MSINKTPKSPQSPKFTKENDLFSDEIIFGHSPLNHAPGLERHTHELAQNTKHQNPAPPNQSSPTQHLLPSGPAHEMTTTNGSSGRINMIRVEVNLSDLQEDPLEASLQQARFRSSGRVSRMIFFKK